MHETKKTFVSVQHATKMEMKLGKIPQQLIEGFRA